MRWTRILQAVFVVFAVLAVALISAHGSRAADFQVYYSASRVLIDHQGQLYGPSSGIGWPQYFRYPPFFVLTFLPLALLPYKIALALWTTLNCIVLYVLVRALARRLDFPQTGFWWLVPVSLCAGFIVQEFGLGNAQFLAFALVAAGLLSLDTKPGRSAFLLALAVSIKVWPLFFVPYLAARRRWRAAAIALGFVAVLALLPAVYFGWGDNLHLIREWAAQEWSTGSMAVGAWFPSQSLTGVLQRYLTFVDYSTWPDPNYLQLHFLNLDSRLVRWISLLLSAASYLALLCIARETPAAPGRRLLLLTDSLALCALPLLEPVSHRIAFVVLLWPAMVAGALLARRGFPSIAAKRFIYAAVAIEFIEPLLSTPRMQRLFQVLGLDFWAVCILMAGLVIAWRDWRRLELERQSRASVELRAGYEVSSRA